MPGIHRTVRRSDVQVFVGCHLRDEDADDGLRLLPADVLDESGTAVVARLLHGEKVAPLCAEVGISRKTGDKIDDRYKDCGLEALTDLAPLFNRAASDNYPDAGGRNKLSPMCPVRPKVDGSSGWTRAENNEPKASGAKPRDRPRLPTRV